MARTLHLVLVGLFLFSITLLNAEPPSTSGSVEVTFGQSIVSLYGPWRFTIGDSPTDHRTGKPLWAQPEFDDSKWETVDLTPKTGSVNPYAGVSGYVPGWTVLGHPGYWGFAWYRIRVQVQARRGEALTLAGPPDIDDIYQVFANGEFAGQFGDFSRNPPTAFYTQPVQFPLARPASDQGSFTEVLAFRVYMKKSTLTDAADVGGIHSVPVLGTAASVDARYQILWLELIRGYAILSAQAPLFGLMAVLAFTMTLFDRADRVYLWIGALFLVEAVHQAMSTLSSWTQHVSIFTDQLFNEGLLNTAIFPCWVMVWWGWFGRQRPSWTPRAAAGLGMLYFLTFIIGREVIPGIVPHAAAGVFFSGLVIVRLLFLALQLWIVFQGIRLQGIEGWMVLPAVLLWGTLTFSAELYRLHLNIRWELFGLSIRLGEISNLLLVLVVAMLLLRRLLKSLANQRLMALDVKQAQEVQQVILPEQKITVRSFQIESEYRPAREVGGDFFQIIPNAEDDSLLIVAGDVAGKGLKAGMLVALLVGAIRTAAEIDPDPGVILAALNRRLLGRGDARATCLALRIGRDGIVTLANAGHLPPYLNGIALEIEGSLPLGLIEKLDCSVLEFRMVPGDRLVMLSDGVAEVTNEEGQLFGFDRVLELVRTGPSAAEIAKAAQAYGQEDDISVISVTRAPVTAPVTA